MITSKSTLTNINNKAFCENQSVNKVRDDGIKSIKDVPIPKFLEIVNQNDEFKSPDQNRTQLETGRQAVNYG